MSALAALKAHLSGPLAPLWGWVAALCVLLLREPAVVLEPTFTVDELRFFCEQYGSSGVVLYRHNGAAQLLPMATSWLFVHLLPLTAVPYAYSLSTLALAALAQSIVLFPSVAPWLPGWPQRWLIFAPLVALPFQGLWVVSGLCAQHLAYFFIAFVLFASSTDPRAGPWLERASRARYCAMCGMFVIAALSAPMSAVLVPLAVYCVLRPSAREGMPRRRIFACVALVFLVPYALIGLDPSVTSVFRGGRTPLPDLLYRGILLFADRVMFEAMAGFSARLWLIREGHRWLVHVLGVVLLVGSIVALYRAAKARKPYTFFAASALYAALSAVILSVLARYDDMPDVVWQVAQFRYFVPTTMLVVVMFVTLAERPLLTLLRSRAAASAIAAWVVWLNIQNAVRYSEPIGELLARSPTLPLDQLPRGLRHQRAQETLAEFERLAAIERSAQAGKQEWVQIADWHCKLIVERR